MTCFADKDTKNLFITTLLLAIIGIGLAVIVETQSIPKTEQIERQK